jgi:hypothetical protein
LHAPRSRASNHECAFRIFKDEFEIRTVLRVGEDRVRARIRVCFPAEVLWKTLARWMLRSHIGDVLRTVLEAFARIKVGDVVLRAGTNEGAAYREIKLRCVT